ncbi:MAG: antitoxin VapB family protein [Candidatus Lokiarchaeota archaeon]|nr:antitoxin VapB family protein [Candidatus Harpocratesius repetitus]
MASKTISVTEKVYMLLKKMKLPSESFGDTIERLCLNFTAGNLIEWFDNSKGWEDMSQSEYNEYYSIIQNFQKNFKAEYNPGD